MPDLTFLTIAEARRLLDAGDISAVELTEACLGRIERVETRIGAFLERTSETALAQARAADQLRSDGKATPLTGIPMALKDVLMTQGIRTTAGSRMLENFVPPYSATVVERLRAAGTVLVGKLNCDEFAMGSSTENSAFGPVHNPWDIDRVPGGSSGGSAAAVAGREAIFTLGSDTGGSIRQPAAFCGVVGVKPTYGRVSRFGLIAFASSLDQIGPFTNTVADAATVLQAIAGHDICDATSAATPVPDYSADLHKGVRGLRIGVPAEYFVEGIAPEVERAIHATIARLEHDGAQVERVSLPHTKYALATYYIIAPAEASANLARFDGVKYGFRADSSGGMWDTYARTRQLGFGAEVKRRILLGTYALSSGYYDAYYLQAQKVRTLVRRDFDEAFQRVDALVAPTTPTTPFKLGEKTADPLAMYLSDVCTVPVNMAGLPGMSLPCGADSAGLPIGVQVIAGAFHESMMFRVAQAIENAVERRVAPLE